MVSWLSSSFVVSGFGRELAAPVFLPAPLFTPPLLLSAELLLAADAPFAVEAAAAVDWDNLFGGEARSSPSTPAAAPVAFSSSFIMVYLCVRLYLSDIVVGTPLLPFPKGFDGVCGWRALSDPFLFAVEGDSFEEEFGDDFIEGSACCRIIVFLIVLRQTWKVERERKRKMTSM